MIDLTTLANALIALLAVVITTYLIPWIRSKTTAQQRAMLEAIVKTLVYAADQIYGAGNGDKKFAYVTEWLESHGYTVDVPLIEATVKEHFGHCGSDEAEDEAVEDAPGVEDVHPPED